MQAGFVDRSSWTSLDQKTHVFLREHGRFFGRASRDSIILELDGQILFDSSRNADDFSGFIT